MVDITVTPANVDKVSGSQRSAEAGVAITAGDSVYVDSGGLLQLCEKDQTAVEAACDGFALNDAGVGQPCTYQVSGVIDIGATIALGEVYVVGGAPGAIAPVADVATSDFATVLGVGVTASNIQIGINKSGVAAD